MRLILLALLALCVTCGCDMVVDSESQPQIATRDEAWEVWWRKHRSTCPRCSVGKTCEEVFWGKIAYDSGAWPPEDRGSER